MKLFFSLKKIDPSFACFFAVEQFFLLIATCGNVMLIRAGGSLAHWQIIFMLENVRKGRCQGENYFSILCVFRLASEAPGLTRGKFEIIIASRRRKVLRLAANFFADIIYFVNNSSTLSNVIQFMREIMHEALADRHSRGERSSLFLGKYSPELWVTMVRIRVFTLYSVDGHAFELNDSKQEKCLKWIQFAILMILK